MRGLDITALVLVIIGAINWGLIGFFKFDLVASLFGNMSGFTRVIYAQGKSISNPIDKRIVKQSSYSHYS